MVEVEDNLQGTNFRHLPMDDGACVDASETRGGL